MSGDVILRNVELYGRTGEDVRVHKGRIAEIGAKIARRGQEIDGRGGALIPGLIDHHIHLLSTAARRESLELNKVRSAPELMAQITVWAAARPQGQWLRATGYHERVAGMLDREDLDLLAPRHPLRVQHQSGSLWMLNSLALECVLGTESPDCVERDARGRATGRIWRGDAWLRGRIAQTAPALRPVGAELARMGVTGLTDASATTDADAAGVLARAHREGEIPQRLTLMSGGRLEAPPDDAYTVGPLKILLDERDLPAPEDVVARIFSARSQGRAVAVHCLTAAELAITLAAFDMAGSRAGDRVEHGGVIPREAILVLVELGLTVVTQPAFVFERGDRYFEEVETADQGDLYRCASLCNAGVPVAASSDAPYSSLDPWTAMNAAIRRRTRAGRLLGAGERVSPASALNLFLGSPLRPGGPPRRVEVGASADLVLLRTPMREALTQLSSELVSTTLIRGRPWGPKPTILSGEALR